MQQPGPERDRDHFGRLLASEFGAMADHYDYIVIEGEFGPADYTMDAFLGYYPDQPFIRFYELRKFGCEITLESARQRALDYKLDDEVTDEQRAVLDVEIPRWRDPGYMGAHWAGRAMYYRMCGLPMCFFAFMVDPAGKQSVVFWYPKHLIPSGVLATIQAAIRSSIARLN